MNNAFQPHKTGQRRLAYIMGPNYSGSTLLTLLLADHPDIATVGELKATAMGDMATYHCSCGDLLTACPFWNKVQHSMSQQKQTFSFDNFGTHFRDNKHSFTDRLFRAALRGPLLEAARNAGFILFPSAQKIKKNIIEQNHSLIEVICTLQQATTFLDDSKEPIRLQFLLEAGLWDIRVIHLIRDGRGVANSYMRHNKTTMKNAAQQWTHTQQECDRMNGLLGKVRCFTLHYEDLCHEPEKNLIAVYEFLDLGAGLPVSSTRTKHIMGNQMRLGSLRDIRLDEKWKQTLTDEDLQIFTTIAGRVNRLHGYK